MNLHSALVADVGGTNIRLAIATRKGLLHAVTYRCAEFDTIDQALGHYLESTAVPDPPTVAAIAVACPVEEDWIDITNQSWSFSIEQVRRTLGLDHLRILNDFVALAAAVPHLKAEDTRTLKPGTPRVGDAIAILGPGTGLGVSGLISSAGRWIPLSAEAGHSTLVATTEREWAVVELLGRKFGRVSNERVLSGPGLVNLYRAICQLEGARAADLTPAAVVSGAKADPSGLEAGAVKMFSEWLGTVAGDFVLSLGARGGLFIGGGVVPKMIDVFDIEGFVDRFLDKGRLRPYVEPVPVRLILNTQIALVGAAAIILGDEEAAAAS